MNPIEATRTDAERLVAVEEGQRYLLRAQSDLNENISRLGRDMAHRFELHEASRRDDRKFFTAVVVGVFGIAGTALYAVQLIVNSA